MTKIPIIYIASSVKVRSSIGQKLHLWIEAKNSQCFRVTNENAGECILSITLFICSASV